MIDKTIKMATTESRAIEPQHVDKFESAAAPDTQAGQLPHHFASTESPIRFVVSALEP